MTPGVHFLPKFQQVQRKTAVRPTRFGSGLTALQQVLTFKGEIRGKAPEKSTHKVYWYV